MAEPTAGSEGPTVAAERDEAIAVPPPAAAVRPASVLPAAGRTAGWGVLVLGALVLAAAGLKAISSVVAPTFLVLTLVITIQPMRTRLIRRGVPSAIASISVLVSVYLLLLLVLGSAVWSLTQMINALPAYSEAFSSLLNGLLDQLARIGIGTAQLRNAFSGLSLTSFAGVAQSLLNTVTSGLTLLALILAMVVFLTFDAAGIKDRMAVIRLHRPNLADAFIDFAGSVRKYWIVTTVFGLIVALVDVIGLTIIGVPLALTWGVLAFVTNYIPNIGFLLGVVPPAIIALLDGGVGSALAVVIVYSAVNVVIQVILQPRFTGDAVGIAPSIAFLSLIVWAYLLGGLGALLAVPATLFVKAVLVDHAPSSRWLKALLDANPGSDELEPMVPARPG